MCDVILRDNYHFVNLTSVHPKSLTFFSEVESLETRGYSLPWTKREQHLNVIYFLVCTEVIDETIISATID